MNRFLIIWLYVLRLASGEREIKILPPLKPISNRRAGMRPHHERTAEVMAALSGAPQGNYAQAISHVRAVTGKGCSRRLISSWKKKQK